MDQKPGGSSLQFRVLRAGVIMGLGDFCALRDQRVKRLEEVRRGMRPTAQFGWPSAGISGPRRHGGGEMRTRKRKSVVGPAGRSAAGIFTSSPNRSRVEFQARPFRPELLGTQADVAGNGPSPPGSKCDRRVLLGEGRGSEANQLSIA